MLRRFLATTVAMASAAVARSPPVVVGLTGSIGIGKSTASNWLKSAGIKVHDADACVHALYAPNGPAVAPVCAAFPGVEATDGSIDRAKLSAALRQPGASIETLNKIVHPLVTADRDAFVLRAAADGEWLVVLDIPLLLETMDATTRYRLLDAIVVVSAPADIQRARVLARERHCGGRRVAGAGVPTATQRDLGDDGGGGRIARRVVDVAVADGRDVKTDQPGGRARVEHERLEVRAGREARDIEEVVRDARAARPRRAGRKGVEQPRRGRPELEHIRGTVPVSVRKAMLRICNELIPKPPFGLRTKSSIICCFCLIQK